MNRDENITFVVQRRWLWILLHLAMSLTILFSHKCRNSSHAQLNYSAILQGGTQNSVKPYQLGDCMFVINIIRIPLSCMNFVIKIICIWFLVRPKLALWKEFHRTDDIVVPKMTHHIISSLWGYRCENIGGCSYLQWNHIRMAYTQPLFLFVRFPICQNYWITACTLHGTFTFYKCRHSLYAVTPVKYKCKWKNITF